LQNSSNKYYIMENLTTYKSNKKFLEERYNLIASGTNKKVYYNGNNNIVFKLFENPNILEGEIVRYQILIENNINFFTPKLKIVNKFVCVSQFAAPIKLWILNLYFSKQIQLKTQCGRMFAMKQ